MARTWPGRVGQAPASRCLFRLQVFSSLAGVAQKKRRKVWLVVVLVVVAVGAGYGCWPRRVNMREFDPARVARLETAMWRDYYEKRYVALFGALYSLSRDEYGFSPWDSVRVSYFAAKAAKDFQPTRSREEAQVARPTLEKYYAVIRARIGEEFDVRDAARLELDWWQLRREKATAAFTICFYAWALLGPLGPDLQEQLDLSDTQIALTTSIPVVLGSLMRIPLGYLTDRYGGRNVLAAGVASP